MDNDQFQHSSVATSAAVDVTSAQGRWREFVELFVGFVLILLALWSAGNTQLIWICTALFWILLRTIRSRPSIRRLGLRITGMRAALWVVALAATMAVRTGAPLVAVADV